MPHWTDGIPSRDQMQILQYVQSHKDVSAREYYNAKGFTPQTFAFQSLLKNFAKLRRRGLIKATKRGGDYFHNAAVTEAEFHDQCLQLIVENLFDGSTEALRASLERLAKTKHRKKK